MRIYNLTRIPGLLSLRVNADADRMARFSRHIESLRKILESRVPKK